MKLSTVIVICIVILVILFYFIAEIRGSNLEWDANDPSDNVTGYHIYRSSTQGANYVKINVNPITDVTYEDVTTEVGIRYYYVASAENADGESGFSNEVTYGICIGDANFDGARNIFDVINVMNHVVGNVILTGDALKAADVNSDTNINILDVVRLQNFVVGNITLEDCP